MTAAYLNFTKEETELLERHKTQWREGHHSGLEQIRIENAYQTKLNEVSGLPSDFITVAISDSIRSQNGYITHGFQGYWRWLFWRQGKFGLHGSTYQSFDGSIRIDASFQIDDKPSSRSATTVSVDVMRHRYGRRLKYWNTLATETLPTGEKDIFSLSDDQLAEAPPLDFEPELLEETLYEG